MTSVAAFIRHAHLYGTESVEEVAAAYLTPGELTSLRIELDVIERSRKSSHGFSNGKRRKRSSEETAEMVEQLLAEGLVPAAVADKLGISDSRLRRVLSLSKATDAQEMPDMGSGVRDKDSRMVEPRNGPESRSSPLCPRCRGKNVHDTREITRSTPTSCVRHCLDCGFVYALNWEKRA